MKFKFSPFLFLRTPVYSYEVNQFEALENLLKTPFFQMAIFAASEVLYRQMEKKDFDFKALDTKVQDSLRKYLNRMCYRPTPFGLFSVFSSASWSELDEGLIFTGKELITVDPDFQTTASLVKHYHKQLKPSSKFYPNSTLYLAGKEYRYFRNNEVGSQQENKLVMLSFKKCRIVGDLLTFCREGKYPGDIIEFLSPVFENENDTEQFLEELTEAEILVSEVNPNITGEKYSLHLTNLLGNLDNPGAQEAAEWIRTLSSIHNPHSLNFTSLPQLALSNKAAEKSNHPFYITHNREVTGGLNINYQEQLMSLLSCSNRLMNSEEFFPLASFKSSFLKKYEGQEVPLLLALDPEKGVGYEKLEEPLNEDELISGLPFSIESRQQNIIWGPVQQLLLRKWTNGNLHSRSASIELTDADLEELPDTGRNAYPPSISMTFRVINNKIVMEHAGGVTANALTGRFTPYNKETFNHNLGVSSLEDEHNPDIIFAEIAYINHEHADNINTREHFRRYEIPVACHSSLPSDRQIRLDDLMISVYENTIVLRSARLNKIVVPRHSTAYNHQRSELPVFRFLCDLQYQGIKSNFTVDLPTLFPGLNSYPGIVYKGNILTTASWILKQEDIPIANNSEDSYKSWEALSERIGLSRFFALTIHDNQLVFDSKNAASIMFFYSTISGKKSITLKEFIMPDQGLVHDHEGKPYINQFVASLYNTEPSYSSNIKELTPFKKRRIQRSFLPGNEWLYFKIYCHNHVADRVLTEEVTSIIKKLRKDKLIKSWFFIRYYDPEHHIRLRVSLNHITDSGQIISIINKKFKVLRETGTLTNIVIDSYTREVERYGATSIDKVEEVFNRSSEVILAFLKISENEDFHRLHLAALSIDDIFSSLNISSERATKILENMYSGLLTEFGGGKKVKVEMDSKYRRLSKDMGYFFKNRSLLYKMIGKKIYQQFTTELAELNEQIRMITHIQKNVLTGDIIHIHLNRIFPTNQRKNEMVVYYLLFKYYQSAQARETTGKLCPAA